MIWRVDEAMHSDGQRRHYREAPKPGGPNSGGSFADQARGGTTPTNTGGSSKGGEATKTANTGGEATKVANKGGEATKIANETSGEATKAANKSISGAIGKSATKGLNAKREIEDIRRTAREDGKGEAALEAGVKVGEAAASKTGVGTAVVAAKNAVEAGIQKITGKKFKQSYWLYIIFFGIFLSFLPIIIFFLVIFFAWDNPRAILSLGWAGMKAGIGGMVGAVISYGGAGKLAYEVDVKPGTPTAVAATAIAAKPAIDTYEYKLSQIDWEKAKYQTLPNDSRCVIKTKEVVSTVDGKKRSVIESIQLNTNPGKELDGVARANCINNSYPIFNAMMRSQFVRDGVNKNLNVRYAYAEPEESANLDKPPSELQKALREKTLTRIWNRGGKYEVAGQATPEQVKASDDAVLEFFGGTRSVQKYSAGLYSQDIIDCANNYVPQGDKFWDKDVDKMNHDLQCGIEPKNLLLYTTLPDESTANDPNPDLAIRPKRAALNTVCDLYDRLLKPEAEATKTYRARVKNRINSAAVAGWQAVTYADTNRARFLNINELNKDFYKIAGMQSGQEYNHSLDGRATGIAIEPDAVSRIVGYYNSTGDKNLLQIDDQYTKGLDAIFAYVNRPVNGLSPCEAAQDKSQYSSPASIQATNAFWNDAYPIFKKAMASIDYYARPEKSQSISQIYNNLTYEDILFRATRLESNVATAGTEDGPQNFNRMNFGMKAYMNGISLAMGGKFLTNNEAVARDESIQLARDYDEQTRGLAYRLFDLENPGSLTSRLRVAFTDKPQKVASNVGSVMATVASPIRNLAGERGTIASLLTGKSRVAMAASTYDSQNLKLDPAGIPEIYSQIDPVQNARFIEGLKLARPDLLQKFYYYELCYREFIPSRFHLLYPDDEKKDLYDNYCKPLFESVNTPNLNSLETRYGAYHFYNLQADALVYLSNPDKEDTSLNANSSLPGEGPAPATGGTGTGSTITGLISPPNLGPVESNGSYKLPRSVDGSYIYDGDNGTGFGQEWDMCGNKAMIDMIYTVAQQFRKTYPNGYLQIGEITSDGHASHKNGVDVDLDGRVGNEWVADIPRPGYSREKTLELAKMFVDTGIVTNIFFNDPYVINASNAYAQQKGVNFKMQSLANHDNHFHVRIENEYRLPTFLYCPSSGRGD